MGSGDSWHLATHRSTTLPCSHARRCARRARELSSFCTTLTTSGNSLTPRQTKKIPECPHLIQHISLVVKVSKLISPSNCSRDYSFTCCCKARTASSIVPEPRVQGSVQFVTFASRPATNSSYMTDSFSTISAAAHVLTSWTFARVVLNSLNRSDDSELSNFTAIQIHSFTILLHLLSYANDTSGIAVALVKRRFPQSRLS